MPGGFHFIPVALSALKCRAFRRAEMLVIPGRGEASNPESRDIQAR
jgi:hypothetical protein